MGASQFTISGTVTLETAQAAAGAKAVRSEIQNLSQTGIAGFERVQQRVIDLTKQVGQLRNELLKTNDPAQQQRLNAALSQSQKELKAARTEMRGMTLETREASEKAQLLAGTLGVQIPAGLGNLIARTQAAQTALGLAFNASIVLAIGAAIVAIIPKLDAWMDKLRGIEEATADIYAEVAKTNAALGAFGKPDSVAAFRVQLRNVAGEIFRIKEQLKSLQTLPYGPEKGAFSPAMWLWNRQEIGLLEDQLKNLIATEKELAGKIPVKEFEDQRTAIEDAAKALKSQNQKELQDYLRMLEEEFTGLADFNRRRTEIELQYENFIATLRHQTAMDVLKTDDENVRQMEQNGARFVKTWTDQVETARRAAEQAAEVQKGAVEQTAQQIESFIDRVFLTARSVSDVFHQFLMQMLSSFVKWVSQMLASWLSGVQGLTGQGGGGGNLFGTILGSLFGGRSSLAGGVSSAVGGSGLTQTGGMIDSFPATAIGGYSAMTTTGAAGAGMSALGGNPATAWIGAGIGGAVAKANPWAALAYGGYKLYNYVYQHGSPLLGSIVGPVGGPVDPFGMLLGAWGRGKLKKKATALEQGFEATADEIYKEFERFKVDYDSALSSLQALIAAGQQSLTSAGLGKWGKAGAENLARSVQHEIDAVKALQKQREANAAIISGMTVPEFHGGGLVPGAGSWGLRQDEVLAILQRGERVIDRDTVRALGVGFLSNLNRAPSFAEGGAVGMRAARPMTVNFNIRAFDGPSVDAWWRRNKGRIVHVIHQAEGDGTF